jgi:CO dehydrogenase maturation factor
MKIGVCGKGGCGKSTLTSLLAREFGVLGKDVFVMDADESNTSLYWMLGFNDPPKALMDMLGGKKMVQQKLMKKAEAKEEASEQDIWGMAAITSDAIPSEYIRKRPGLKLVSTGKILQALEGCACPMGAVTRRFLEKLQLKDNEIAIVDMEAGIEHFGRGIESHVDKVITIVEPSLESITLAAKIKSLAENAGALFSGAILNKISSVQQENQVKAKLVEFGVPCLGGLPVMEDVQNAGLTGKPIRMDDSARINAIASRLLV